MPNKSKFSWIISDNSKGYSWACAVEEVPRYTLEGRAYTAYVPWLYYRAHTEERAALAHTLSEAPTELQEELYVQEHFENFLGRVEIE